MVGEPEKGSVNPEDLISKQGVHAMHRGFKVSNGRAVDFLFPPSYFAMAAFGLTERRAVLFNDLISRIEKNSRVAKEHPHITEWMEQVRKNGRPYWDGDIGKEKRVDFLGLQHDIRHSEVERVVGKQRGEHVGPYTVVDVDESGRCYVERAGKIMPAHRHIASAAWLKDKLLELPDTEKGKLGILDESSPYGFFGFRVRSRRSAAKKYVLSNWLVGVWNPFVNDHVRRDFNIYNQSETAAYDETRGWLWSNLDKGVLDELERKGLDTTREKSMRVVDFHVAVALTKLFAEKRKKPEERKIGFLATDEDRNIIMPYNFIGNPAAALEPVVMRYGLGMQFDEIDDWLLDKRQEITTEQFKKLQLNNQAFLEVARMYRGMVLPETRRIIKRQHLDLADKGYSFKGFAVDLDESRGDAGFRTIGLVFEHPGKRWNVYVLYDEKIQYPLLHVKDFGGAELGSDLLFGGERDSARPQRMNPGLHPLLQLEQRFEETDYRTGQRCFGRFEFPSVLNEQEKQLYAQWMTRLQS